MKATRQDLVRLLELARAGRTQADAAAHVGISDRTLRTYLARGAEDDATEDEIWFLGEWTRARSDFKSALENVVYKIAKSGLKEQDQLKAASFALERRFPKDWGPQVNREVAAAMDVFMTAMQRELTPEEFRRVCEVASRIDGSSLAG